VLSTENGNLHSFEYVNHDYPIDLKQELYDWAKQYGWEWQCEYTGTYILTEAYGQSKLQHLYDTTKRKRVLVATSSSDALNKAWDYALTEPFYKSEPKTYILTEAI
jgi:hypothetical protein